MATRESGTYLEHKGRPDPNHPGLFVCSRCGLRYNADGKTVDMDGTALEHADDCLTKVHAGHPRAIKAIIERVQEAKAEEPSTEFGVTSGPWNKKKKWWKPERTENEEN